MHRILFWEQPHLANYTTQSLLLQKNKIVDKLFEKQDAEQFLKQILYLPFLFCPSSWSSGTEIHPCSNFTSAHRALKALNIMNNSIKWMKLSICLKLSPCFKCPDELDLHPKLIKSNESFHFHSSKFGLQNALDFKCSRQLVLNLSWQHRCTLYLCSCLLI